MRPEDEHDAGAALSQLKDFQRRTAVYVFRRFYTDAHTTSRFLVADEVGLGKTLVARAVIAQAARHLQRKRRVQIVYVSSNAAIAKQNVNRLQTSGTAVTTQVDRLTMLPRQSKLLTGHRVHLVAFTPGTSFEVASRGGTHRERALIFHMLRGKLSLKDTPLRNLLQLSVGKRAWEASVSHRDSDFDQDLAMRFVKAVGKDRGLLKNLREACKRFVRHRKHIPALDQELRLKVIGSLRRALARVCVASLKPDLVVLDEFQRFKHLLTEESEAALIAQELWRSKGARVLLLSATPYRMLTLGHEDSDDHYEDLVATLGFLLDDDGELEELRDDFRRYRHALYGLPAGQEEARTASAAIERRLRRVMARTERIDATCDANAMLSDIPVIAKLEPNDLVDASVVEALAQCLGAGSVVEYWKSAPYLVSFMRDYDLKRRLVECVRHPSVEVLKAVREAEEFMVRKTRLDAYDPMHPANARLRTLFAETLDVGQWRVLWVPPALPYFAPSGAYRETGQFTKSLVFSCWNVVPAAVASMVSYEAERRMVEGRPDLEYHRLSEQVSQPLRFAIDKGPANMTGLMLLYPCQRLAEMVDPLEIAIGHGKSSLVTPSRVLSIARQTIASALRETGQWPTPRSGRTDQRWYWAALAMLDARGAADIGEWCGAEKGWLDESADEGDGHGAGFRAHVEEFAEAIRGALTLGRAPDDLVDVLAEFAIAGPGVCALRALRRLMPRSAGIGFQTLDAAANVAEALRSLFNQPETVVLLRGDDESTPYWRRVLQHGIEGNLQAVLDEYFHCLRDSLGLVGHDPETVVRGVAEATKEALSLRGSPLEADEVAVSPDGKLRIDPMRLRCRFALQFGDARDEREERVVRAATVREAFNSPFRPFILATTSIGQEGLDFHTYCHRVYHWNLPSNPVDLEQREGRVHRYKGHAVRRNVALAVGVEGLRRVSERVSDPWETLFTLATESRQAGVSDLVPYWVFETDGGVSVERRIPMLPFSRECARLPELRRSLALYRLAFGQPRQEDLIGFLKQVADAPISRLELGELRIRLGP